jgi:TonB family protein
MRRWAWLLAGFSVACVGGPPSSTALAPVHAEPGSTRTNSVALPATPPEGGTTRPAVPPCALPAEIGIAARNGRVLLNGSDLEALSADTPRPSALIDAVDLCLGEEHRYTFDFEPGAPAEATRELLDEAPREPDRVELLAFAKSPPIAVLRAVRSRLSGHWVKLSVEPHRIAVRELHRDKSQLKAPPVVASERTLSNLSAAYTWLRATCRKEPCTGIAFVLSPEQTNAVIASALRAISTPNGPTPLIEIRKDDEDDSNELPRFGRLPPEEIQGVVRNAYEGLRRCYEDGLGRNANLEGRVSVRFDIDIDGSVKNSTLAPSDLPDAEVARCVVEHFTKLHFPPPDGGVVTVVYPIMFSPG